MSQSHKSKSLSPGGQSGEELRKQDFEESNPLKTAVDLKSKAWAQSVLVKIIIIIMSRRDFKYIE